MAQQRLNDKSITLYEILKEANSSDTPVDVLKNYMQKDPRMTPILGYWLNPRFKMSSANGPLPEGVPPYIPSTHPLGVAPLEILKLHNKLYIIYSKDTKRFKKEEIFIQWLEDMAPEEAALMLNIKDQTLPEEFSKLTIDVFISSLGWSKDQYLALVKT
jgi:hypothetical protein